MEKGRAVHSPLFVMRWLKTEDHSRVSAVVPKKVLKTAAARNNLRRRMYESLKPFMELLLPGTHAIVFAKAGADEKEFAGLADETRNIFVKAGLLK